MDFKAVAVVILCLVYLYGLLLDILRYRSARNPIPQNVADVYDADTYLRWKAYHGEKVRWGIFTSAAGFVVDLIFEKQSILVSVTEAGITNSSICVFLK